ncbi:phosphoglycolate phosphatase [Luteimonas notoginsengisoli]|uniref:Phosphoglycolate phosphatase n=1 Tax=Luteimonas notoginsengisoli TaxID=1578200 RepID=A0ABV7URD9_9GAMM
MTRFPRLVLFDLDGTLLDSAPDMLAAINALRGERGEAPGTLDALRPHVSKGARAMIASAFPLLDADAREALVRPFLDAYEREIGLHGRPFDGIEEMLAALEADGARWGIVTNKPEYLARQVLPAFGWDARSAILVGGDTLAERKPHPLPLLHSAQALGVEPAQCAYVGDDERDIMAARAAGMPSVVALWGYRLDEDDPVAWQGDVMADTPHGLTDPLAWPRR